MSRGRTTVGWIVENANCGAVQRTAWLRGGAEEDVLVVTGTLAVLRHRPAVVGAQAFEGFTELRLVAR